LFKDDRAPKLNDKLSNVANPLKIYIDGSHIKGTDKIGYGAFMDYNGTEYTSSQVMDRKAFQDKYKITDQNAVSNPTTELAAAVHILKAFENKSEHIEIIYDYNGVGGWLTGEWKTREAWIKDIADEGKAIIKKIKANGGSVSFKWVKGHSGNHGNNKADEQARSRMKYDGISDFINKEGSNKQDTLFQQISKKDEEIGSEKIIRDIATRLTSRIGIDVVFENDPGLKYKGKLVGNVAYVNLAYATPDTPIHEIIGHPIIRVIKNMSGNYTIKDTSTGFVVYPRSDKAADMSNYKSFDTYEEAVAYINGSEELYYNLLKELEYGRGKEVLDRIKKDYVYKNPTVHEIADIVNEYNFSLKSYIETLITAGYKADVIVDQVISEYPRVDGEYMHFNYQDADGGFTPEFPGDTGVEPWTTMEEVIEGLVKSDKINIQREKYTLDEQREEALVELLGLMTSDLLDENKDRSLIAILKELLKQMSDVIKSLFSAKELKVIDLPNNITLKELAILTGYSNSKLILPGGKVTYRTPDNMVFETHTEASRHVSNIVDIPVTKVEQIPSRGFTVDKHGRHSRKDRVHVALYKGKWTYSLIGKDRMSITENEALRLYKASLEQTRTKFIMKNREFEKSKQILEEWKSTNNIKYNPQEVYDRGQGFYSILGVYSTFDLELLLQNLLNHIPGNKKAGGEYVISAYTRQVDRRLNYFEGREPSVRFKIFPKSEDIKWASNGDMYSGSVWDASASTKSKKASEIQGVSYSKYPSLHNIHNVKSDLATIIDAIDHNHNELGIELTTSNFRLEYDGGVESNVKTLVDSINSILDERYGKLQEPSISNKIKEKPYKYLVIGDKSGHIYSVHDKKEDAEHSSNDEFPEAIFIEKTVVNASLLSKIKKGLFTSDEVSIKSIAEKEKYTFDIDRYREQLYRYNEAQAGVVYERFHTFMTVNGTSYRFLELKNKLVVFKSDIRNDRDEIEISDGEIIENEHGTNFLVVRPELLDRVLNTIKKPIMPKSYDRYDEQIVINEKIASLKEHSQKFPRSLITSKVQNALTPNSNSLFPEKMLIIPDKDIIVFDDPLDLPFQRIPSGVDETKHPDPVVQDAIDKWGDLIDNYNNPHSWKLQDKFNLIIKEKDKNGKYVDKWRKDKQGNSFRVLKTYTTNGGAYRVFDKIIKSDPQAIGFVTPVTKKDKSVGYQIHVGVNIGMPRMNRSDVDINKFEHKPEDLDKIKKINNFILKKNAALKDKGNFPIESLIDLLKRSHPEVWENRPDLVLLYNLFKSNFTKNKSLNGNPISIATNATMKDDDTYMYYLQQMIVINTKLTQGELDGDNVVNLEYYIQSLMHEILHSFTAEAVDNPYDDLDRTFKREAGYIFDKAKKKFPDSKEAGLTKDLHEFMAEFMTDPNFAETLDDIEGEGRYEEDKRGLFTRLKDSFITWLTGKYSGPSKEKIPTTLREDFNKLITDYITTQTNYRGETNQRPSNQPYPSKPPNKKFVPTSKKYKEYLKKHVKPTRENYKTYHKEQVKKYYAKPGVADPFENVHPRQVISDMRDEVNEKLISEPGIAETLLKDVPGSHDVLSNSELRAFAMEQGNKTELDKLIHKAKLALSYKIDAARKSGDVIQQSSWGNYLMQLQENVESPEETVLLLLKQAIKSIDTVYNEMLEAKESDVPFTAKQLTKWSNYVSAYDVLEELEAFFGTKFGLIDGGIVDDLDFSDLAKPSPSIFFNKRDKQTLRSLLQEALRNKNVIQHMFKQEGIPLLARHFAPFYNGIRAEIKEEAGKKYRQLKVDIAKGRSTIELTETEEEYVDSILEKKKDDIEKDTIALLEKELWQASRDISLLTRWFENMLDTPDPVAAAMVKAFARANDIARLKIIEERIRFERVVRKLEKQEKKAIFTNPFDYYNWIIEIAEDKETKEESFYLILPYKTEMMEEYRRQGENVRAEAYEILSMKKRGLSNARIAKAMNVHESVVKVALSPDGPIKMRMAKLSAWKEGTTDREGNAPLRSKDYAAAYWFFLDDLQNETREDSPKINRHERVRLETNAKAKFTERLTLTEMVQSNLLNIDAANAIEKWRYENSWKFRTPSVKWRNPKWVSFMNELGISNNLTEHEQLVEMGKSTNAKAEFYLFMRDAADRADKFLPFQSRLNNRLPGVPKNALEKMKSKQSPLTYFTESLKQSLTTVPEDIDRAGALQEVRDEKDNVKHFLPVWYTAKLEKVRQSFDVPTIYYKFLAQSIDYNERSKILPEMEMAKTIIDERNAIKRNAFDKPLTKDIRLTGNRDDEEKKSSSIKDFLKRIFTSKNTKLASQLDDFFVMSLYGQKVAHEGYIKIPFTDVMIDKSKAADLLLRYTSLNLLAFNVVQGVANIGIGETMQAIDAFAGEHVGIKEYAWAKGYYTKHLPSMMGDAGLRTPVSMQGLLIEEFDVLHEDPSYVDFAAGHRVSQIVSNGGAFFMVQYAGEHSMQGSFLFAMLKRQKAYDSNGKHIGSIIDYYKVKDKRLVFDPEGKVDIEKSNWSTTDRLDFGYKLRGILSRMHGEYGEHGRVAAQRYAMGRIVYMFRKFVMPGFRRRYGKRRYIERLGYHAEGNYRTTARFATEFMKGLKASGLAIAMEDWSTLSEHEKSNIHRTLSELVWLATLLVLASALMKAEPDDDTEEYVNSFLAYQVLRLKTELLFFSPKIDEAMNILRSPAASMSVADGFYKLFSQMWHPSEVYQRGPWKGQPKIQKDIISMIPMYRQFYRARDIGEQISWFQ